MSGRRVALLALSLLGLYVLLLLRLFGPAGGLLGRYLVTGQNGVEAPVHERIDPRIDFPVPQGIDSAFVFHWDQRRLGDFPRDSMPPYVIHWTGFLRAPRTGVYDFSLDTHGEAALSIDGSLVQSQPDTGLSRTLSAGWHPIAIDYRLDIQGDARLILSWRPPGQRLRPIPSEHLAPDRDSIGSADSARRSGWLLLFLGVAGGAWTWWRSRRTGSAAAALVAALREERVTLALGAILILAAVLRFHDYALVPFHHETADEYQHAWEGWTLLHEGMPKAWSTFPDRYPLDRTVEFRWFGDRYTLVWPYFDHPPLFSLIVGLATSLAQPSTYAPPWDFLSCTLPVIRVVPILLSLAGVLLLFRLARAYGASENAALLGALVYAVLPVIVLAHRLVKAESLLSLLFMGAILAVRRHEESGRTVHAIVVGILCGLSIWTKATGVAVLAVAVVMLVSKRRHRGAVLAVGVTAGFVLMYLAYAWALDFDVFRKVIEAQSTTKWVGLEALQDLLSGKIVTRYFGRGWYLWLLLCAAATALRKERALLLPLTVYATIIVMTADYRVIYGWYRIPLYPFLCVAAGIYLEEMIREADLYRTFPFAITAVITGLLYSGRALPFAATLTTTQRFEIPGSLASTKGVVALFAVLTLAPFVARLIHESNTTVRAARLATHVLLILLILTSIATIDRLLEIYSATRGIL